MIDLFTIVFVLVDDWNRSEGIKLLRGKAGVKPEFTDSEMITLMLVQEYIPETFKYSSYVIARTSSDTH